MPGHCMYEHAGCILLYTLWPILVYDILANGMNSVNYIQRFLPTKSFLSLQVYAGKTINGVHNSDSCNELLSTSF